MYYYLADEPKVSGTLLAGAFNAIDQAYGTEPFTEGQAVKAITTVVAVGTEAAALLFRELASRQHVTPDFTKESEVRITDPSGKVLPAAEADAFIERLQAGVFHIPQSR